MTAAAKVGNENKRVCGASDYICMTSRVVGSGPAPEILINSK